MENITPEQEEAVKAKFGDISNYDTLYQKVLNLSSDDFSDEAFWLFRLAMNRVQLHGNMEQTMRLLADGGVNGFTMRFLTGKQPSQKEIAGMKGLQATACAEYEASCSKKKVALN